MKISVITITCRNEPRLQDMARTMLASLARTKDINLEWVIVDELARDLSDLEMLLSPWSDRFSMVHVAPYESLARTGPDKTPAHNSARNAGLRHTTGDYIVFLNDCTVITADWVSTIGMVADLGHGWRCRQIVLADLKISPDKPLTVGTIPDKKWRTIPPGTIGGSCWGAPAEAFATIGGFDLAFDGELSGHDVEAAIRLQRVGVTFVTTTRAVAIQLRRTATRDEVTSRKEVFGGTRNKNYIAALIRESHRTLPMLPSRHGTGASAGQAKEETGPVTDGSPANPAPDLVLAQGPARTAAPASLHLAPALAAPVLVRPVTAPTPATGRRTYRDGGKKAAAGIPPAVPRNPDHRNNARTPDIAEPLTNEDLNGDPPAFGVNLADIPIMGEDMSAEDIADVLFGGADVHDGPGPF